MTKKEFIDEIKAFVDDIENKHYHITELDEKVTLFGNKNYGQIWVKLNDACTINIDLYHATDEERKED